jgi:hypothetical protein
LCTIHEIGKDQFWPLALSIPEQLADNWSKLNWRDQVEQIKKVALQP